MRLIFTFYSFLVLTIMLLCLGQNSEATHIVGGEMNYSYQGNNIYNIKLTVYRDCYNGQATFDDPASIGIFDASNNLVASTLVFITTQQSVPNIINTPCLIPPTNVCYEVATYSFSTILPPIAGGYQIVYQRCCRNHTVVNLANVASTGATYLATIPDPSITVINSNPVFKNWPPTFICQNAPFTFDHSAIDYDGDSLVYELCMPLRGASQSDPAPQPPNNPPYQPVTFLNPYSLTNPLGGVPMTINRRTGILKATPDRQGQFVYGICVKEFRNGIYLGETRRDFQVNVVPCPMITVASIFSPNIVCGSLRAEFMNNSYNADFYSWDFGDPSSQFDTSSLRNPSWEYPDTGVYIATLIAYSNIDSLCNDTAIGIVKVYPEFNAHFGIQNTFCTPDFQFFDQSYGLNGAADYWYWNFGDNNISLDSDPFHSYAVPGSYEVTLISSTDSACLDTLSRMIHVLQVPVADFSTQLDTCSYELTATNNSLYASGYLWETGSFQMDTSVNLDYQYSNPGAYQISLTAVSDSGCTDTRQMNLQIPPLPKAGFDYFSGPCDSLVSFRNLSQFAVSYNWDFGDNDTSSDMAPYHTYELAGRIPVNLYAKSVYGCIDTIEKNIFLVSYKEADFNTRLDTCSGLVHFVEVTRNAVYYHWDFGDGDTSNLKNPVHSYQANGEYTVTLTVNNETSCQDQTIKQTVYESPFGELVFVPNAFTPNSDGINDVFRLSVFRPCDTYRITIFNRWGQRVYENEDAAFAEWDGTFEGRKAEAGTYIYILKGSSLEKKGAVFLIR